MSKILKFFISSIVYGVILVSTITISLIVYYSNDLPSYDKLYEYYPPTVTKVYAANGKLIEEYAREYRIFLPFNDIPKNVVNAFLAAEDGDYYKHPGIDLRGIARAFFQNIININQHKSLVGGSTITQQVVKNFLLSDEKSLRRKIQEAILSFRISATISKDRILELYLNQIFLGNRSYGIGSASLNYFDKNVNELDIAEAAMLAALPKAPSKYNPFLDYSKALNRRNWVLQRMFENGFITQIQLGVALNEQIELKPHVQPVFEEDYFAEEVRQIIADQYGKEAVYNDGFAIHTTCDLHMQNIAQRALQKHLLAYDQGHDEYRGPLSHTDIKGDWPKELVAKSKEIMLPVSTWQVAMVLESRQDAIEVTSLDGIKKTMKTESLQWLKKTPKSPLHPGDIIYIEPDFADLTKCFLRQIPEVNGSVVIMNPKSGKVMALVGGFSYKTSVFNRATQAIRQPGSAFKPFVYLAALEQNLPPTTILEDSPIELFQGHNLPLWTPKNYGDNFLGPLTLRVALEKSRNIPTIRLAQKVGIGRISDMARRFDIYDQKIENLSAVLGSIDTTPLKLINAYAMIVNGGYKIMPLFIDKIEDRGGNVVYEAYDYECKQCEKNADGDPVQEQERVTDEQSAYQLVSILNGATKRGTARRAGGASVTIGGKTGTTNESKDAWFIGFSPDLVVGVFIGFDQPKSLGDKVSGGTLALPVFNDIAAKVFNKNEDRPFKVPAGINFYPVDLNNGYLVSGGANQAGIIMEAFKEGTMPNEEVIIDETQSLQEFALQDDPEMQKLLSELESGQGEKSDDERNDSDQKIP